MSQTKRHHHPWRAASQADFTERREAAQRELERRAYERTNCAPAHPSRVVAERVARAHR